MSLLRFLPPMAAAEAATLLSSSFRPTPRPTSSFSVHLLLSTKKRFSFARLVASEAAAGEDATFATWSDTEAAAAEQEEQEEGAEWGLDEEGEEGEEEGDGAFASGEEAGEGVEGGEYVEPPEEAKLFVGNMPFDMDSEGLAQLFEQAGIVEVAEVIYNRETDQSRGFGFVTMSTVEEADKAVEMLNRYDINGRLLTVNKAAPRGSRVERTPRQFASAFRVYVGNLPWQVDESRLEQVFSEHGKVVDAKVVYDRETGRSRGFGFVTMASKEELDDAIAALDGQNLDGRALRVNVAADRPPRRGGF